MFYNNSSNDTNLNSAMKRQTKCNTKTNVAFSLPIVAFTLSIDQNLYNYVNTKKLFIFLWADTN